MKTAVLIQAHKNEDYIIKLALQNKDVRFYVHMDAKFPDKIKWLKDHAMENLIILNEPVAVYWGGSSQVTATLRLMEIAYAEPENYYFHLMSSECIPLKSFEVIEKEWDCNPERQYIESHKDKNNEWRLKVRVLHSDTPYLRTFIGRCINKLLKYSTFLYDSVKFGRENFYFGSQWFSVSREFVDEVLKNNNATNFFSDFKNITCADEHAFAIFAKTLYKQKNNVADNNKRFIKFCGKASPEYLSERDLESLIESGEYWFSRKHKKEFLLKYCEMVK